MTEWFLLAVLGGLASNVFNFFNRLFLKDEGDSTAYAWFFSFLRFAMYGGIMLFDWHLVLTIKSLTVLFLLGITEFIAVYFYMKMHANAHLSISTILSRSRLIWIPVFAFFLIGARLSSVEYLGIIVIFLGLSITSAPGKLFVDKGMLYANLAAVFIAVNAVFMKMALPYGSNSVINLAMVIPPVILFPFFMKKTKTRIIAMTKERLTLKVFATALNVLSTYLLIMALRTGDVSKVNSVYQGMMVVSVLFGIVFLKETEDIGRKLIGMSVSLFGIFLLNGL